MAETILAATALASLGYQATQGVVTYNKQKHLAEDQARALEQAEREQEQADLDAEKARLEVLAVEQTGGNRVEAEDFGIDSTLASRYLAENKKRQAKAQQLLEEDENPFYNQGLF